MVLRNSYRLSSLIFLLLISIFPEIGSYKRQIKFAMVDLPLPVFPKIPNVVFSFILRLIFFNALIPVSGYVKLTF